MTARAIADELTREIVSGVIKPGEGLHQAELADRFGVSRIPVRDALGLLAAENLVTVTPNRGARVVRLDAAEIREVYDLRILLECDCLIRAIPEMDDRFLDEMEIVRRRSDLDAHTSAWADGDRAFHTALYEPARRPQHLALIDGLRRTCQIHIAAYGALPRRTPRWLDDHATILAFCRDRRAVDAAAVLESHLRAACGSLIGILPILGSTVAQPG